jgi:hypothetical protein
MANDGVDMGRRRFLTATTAVVGGAGIAMAAIPFIKSWQPSARAKTAGAPVEADISKLELGQMVMFEWRGQPIWIIRRTQAQLDVLSSLDPQLKDPKSEVTEQQPAFAKNEYRSESPSCLSRRIARPGLRPMPKLARVFDPDGRAASSVHATSRASTWRVASMTVCRRPPTWWCRRTTSLTTTTS